MLIELFRYSDNGDSTQGLLFIDKEFFCYTLEDEHRDKKVKSETRIPSGLYDVEHRKVLSPMTEKYRNRFDWFSYHLQIKDVENFTNVYIHLGNKDEDTDGCILVSDAVTKNHKQGEAFNGSSTPAFKRLYKKVSKELKQGGQVQILVTNENFFY